MKCPICKSNMYEIEVAPCYDCGHSDSELKELEEGKHEYFQYKIFGEDIVLCDFCDADFNSFYPNYFGLVEGLPQEYPFEEKRIKIENPEMKKDLYCEKCQHRFAFLNFLKIVREKNANT